jgi:hypothetical protein
LPDQSLAAFVAANTAAAARPTANGLPPRLRPEPGSRIHGVQAARQVASCSLRRSKQREAWNKETRHRDGSCWRRAKRRCKREARGPTPASGTCRSITSHRSNPKPTAKPIPRCAHSIRRPGPAGACLRCATMGVARQHTVQPGSRRSAVRSAGQLVRPRVSAIRYLTSLL